MTRSPFSPEVRARRLATFHGSVDAAIEATRRFKKSGHGSIILLDPGENADQETLLDALVALRSEVRRTALAARRL